MKELVSILIPAYNAEKWIRETINSALNQTWPNKEIIIVDDGSSDNTLTIAREFEPHSVKVITQKNKGASAARNAALGHAQGDYIQWLDADDLLAHDKISQQLNNSDTRRDTLVLLSSAFAKFYYRFQKAKFSPNPLWQDLSPVEWLVKRFSENCWMQPSSWLVNRRLTELAGPWDERLSFDDDGEYFCRVVVASEKVKFLPEAKSYYRQSNINSLSRGRSEKACKSLFLSYSLCINHLRSLEDSERTRAACLKLLQHWHYHFYPENTKLYPEKDELLCDLLHKINDLANEVGGTPLLPELNWKHVFVNKIVGWKAAMIIRDIVYNAKTLAGKNWDKLLYNLSTK